MFVSFYLLMIGLLGWDLLYHLFKFRTMSEEQAWRGQPYCVDKRDLNRGVKSTHSDGHSALR